MSQAAPKKKKSGFHQDPDAPRFVCGGEITGDAVITSPGFDDQGHYFNNLDCTWEINIPGVSGFTIIPEFSCEAIGQLLMIALQYSPWLQLCSAELCLPDRTLDQVCNWSSVLLVVSVDMYAYLSVVADELR